MGTLLRSALLPLSLADTTALKGIAIIFVLLGHLEILPVAQWGVGLFLFLSGYGVTVSFQKKGLDYFFARKILKVWLPYVFLFLLELLIDALKGQYYPLSNLLLSFFGLNLSPQVDMSMWFVGYIMLWYIVIFFVFKYTPPQQILPGLLLAVIPVLILSFPPLALKASGCWWYLFAFPLGVVAAFESRRINNFLACKSSRWLLFLCLGVSIVLYPMDSYFSFFAEIYLITLLCVWGGSILHVGRVFILKSTGKISYEIYLFEAVLIWKYPVLSFTDIFFINIVFFIAILLLLSCIYKELMQMITARLQGLFFRLIEI